MWQPGLFTHKRGLDIQQERLRPQVPHTCRWEEGEVAGEDRGRGGHRERTA